MDEKNFDLLNAKLDAIMKKISDSHKEQFSWAQALHNFQMNQSKQIENRQMRIEKAFNISDETLPFEPYYNRSMNISSAYPEIFNKYGEPMQVYFISDSDFAHAPQDKNSRYIIWDRYNYGLKTHFYSNNQMFQIVGKPEKKFAMISEPRSILPGVYQNVLANKDYVEKNFDAIFTHDSEILSTFKNAKLYLNGKVWYGRNIEGIMYEGKKAGFSDDGGAKDITISEDNYKRKNKNISMISSHKELCPLHVLRKNLALRLKKNNSAGVDTFGTFDGSEYCARELPFEFYRYSVVLENYISEFYFTEKILDCFASETIPIYLGATQIDKFFNPDGIIKISVEDCNNIEEILKQCTPEEYERRLPAVIENFWRVQEYIKFTPFDRIYLKYLK